MIQIFTGARGPGVSPALDNMFADRKRVFVDLLGWRVPVIDGMFEVDQFDTERAVYLVSATASDEHLGSIRLLPTEFPHLLGSLFPELCDGPTPSGCGIFEITRGCLSPKSRAAERLRTRNRLITAAVRYAVLKRITAFTCVADSGWLSQILSLGWDCEPLGNPALIEGVVTGALRIQISSHTVAQLQRAGVYSDVELSWSAGAEGMAA
jgi:acyl-homoserine lactone synthase